MKAISSLLRTLVCVLILTAAWNNVVVPNVEGMPHVPYAVALVLDFALAPWQVNTLHVEVEAEKAGIPAEVVYWMTAFLAAVFAGLSSLFV